MKKLYTMLAAALMAGSAIAAPLNVSNKATITPEGGKLLQERAITAMQHPEMLVANEMGTRSFTNGNTIYTIRMFKEPEITWTDIIEFTEQDVTFKDFPFYVVISVISGYDTNTGNLNSYYPIYMLWPAHYIYDQYWIGGGENIPENERDYTPVSLTQMATDTQFARLFKECKFGKGTNGGFNFEPMPEGMENNNITAWKLFPPAMGPTGEMGLLYRGQKADTYQDGNLVMTFDYKNYLEDSQELSNMIKMPLQFEQSNGTIRKTTLNIDFNGTIRDDMESHTVNFQLFDVHLFNCGEVSTKILGAAKDPYTHPWGPLQRYYLAAAGNEYIDVMVPDGMTAIDSSKIAFAFKDSAPAEVQTNPESQSYLKGALYSAVGEGPQGKWTIVEPTGEYISEWKYGDITFTPEAGSAIPAYDPYIVNDEGKEVEMENIYPSYDGMLFFYQGMSDMPYQGTQIAIGTTEGLQIIGHDNFQNGLNGQFSGMIKYHSDPTNVKVVEEISATGTIENVEEIAGENGTIRVINGEVVINASKDCEVEVYTLDGAKVAQTAVKGGDVRNIKLANGLYIIKAGNDVKKVVL